MEIAGKEERLLLMARLLSLHRAHQEAPFHKMNCDIREMKLFREAFNEWLDRIGRPQCYGKLRNGKYVQMESIECGLRPLLQAIGHISAIEVSNIGCTLERSFVNVATTTEAYDIVQLKFPDSHTTGKKFGLMELIDHAQRQELIESKDRCIDFPEMKKGTALIKKTYEWTSNLIIFEIVRHENFLIPQKKWKKANVPEFGQRKIPNAITLPDVLKLDGQRYELTASINHRGTQMGNGHYVSAVKANGVWRTLDDAKILNMPHGYVKSTSCTVLMYSKVAYMGRHVGIENPNNLCYINGAFQMIFSSSWLLQEMRDKLKQELSVEKVNTISNKTLLRLLQVDLHRLADVDLETILDRADLLDSVREFSRRERVRTSSKRGSTKKRTIIDLD